MLSKNKSSGSIFKRDSKGLIIYQHSGLIITLKVMKIELQLKFHKKMGPSWHARPMLIIQLLLYSVKIRLEASKLEINLGNGSMFHMIKML